MENHPEASRPKPFWKQFKYDLAEGFSDLCAYTVIFTPNGTVDHFLSCRNRPDLAYEWSNYRYAAGWINSSKKTLDDAILDPFEVEDGWFEIILPSCQLVLSDRIPPEYRQKAEFTLKRLRLRDDEGVIRYRYAWYRMYVENKLDLDELSKKAPLIAAAVLKKQSEEA